MLTEKNESKSLRVGAVNEEGTEVMSSSATYSDRNISVSFDILNRSYCAAHKDDVQSAMSAFLVRLNAALDESGLPQVITV